MFAVVGVVFVEVEAAGVAGEFDFWRAEHGLDEAEEKGYAENHDDDGEDFSWCTLECDIAEACGGQCCDGEIHGVDKVFNARVTADLRHENQFGHHKNKDDQIGRA